MAELRGYRGWEGRGEQRAGGKYEFVDGVREAYLDDLVGDFKMTASSRSSAPPVTDAAAFVRPETVPPSGVEVVPIATTTLDYTFPHYKTANPERR